MRVTPARTARLQRRLSSPARQHLPQGRLRLRRRSQPDRRLSDAPHLLPLRHPHPELLLRHQHVINSENLTIKCAEDGHWCPKDLNYTDLVTSVPGGKACVNRICQDDNLSAGEQCDRNQLGGIDDCTDLGYVGSGAITTCDTLCTFDTGACQDSQG